MSLRFQQKLIIPATTRPLVERPRLLAELEEVVTNRRVVALAAPAGWGKTTTLAQWAAGSRLPVAWYTLDPADRDPQLFLDYLLHSVAAFVPAAAEIVTRLSTTAPQGLPDLIHATALAISAAPEPFALVLDDFHVLDEEPRSALPGAVLVFDLLASVAQYAGNCHLVIASRTLPTLHGLVRMVAQGRAAVFDYAALQFSAAEIQQLAGMTYALTLSDESAGQLVDQLNGWITGIVLSLDRSAVGGQRSSLQTFEYANVATQREALVEADTAQVYAYFVEQVIAPLPPELLRFLEETSVLEDLSPRRCEALRKTGDASELLDEVKRHGLFVSSRAGWLAYHSLFRDFLRARLARDPHRHQSLLLRAGDLYRDEEDLERALDCYLAAGAADQAIDLLRAAIPSFRQRSRQTTLLACFERLGQELGVRSWGLGSGAPNSQLPTPNPQLLPPDLLLAEARVYSDMAQWEQAYLALQLVETIGDQTTRWEARMLNADFLNLQGDYARARAALDEVPASKLPPRLQLEYHVIAGRAQILSGEVTAAIKSLEKARGLAPADDAGVLADIHDNLGWAYATQGDRPAALRHLKRADACWQASGNSGRRALTLNNLGTLAMEEGRYDEARAAIESGLDIARATARRREETLLRCSMAEVDIMEGELEQAIGRFTEAHTLSMRMDVSSSVEAAAAGALWAAALAGDLAVAQAWLDIAAAIVAPGQPEVRGRLALGQALLMQHQPRPNQHDLADLAAEATAAEPYLSPPERAYLALLRATLTFERSGWPRAASEWETFASRAAELAEPLLLRFVPPHQRAFEAAAPSSKLARRLVDILKQPAPSRWQVTMLGAFECLIDGAPCDLSPLHRALLARLLDAGPQGLTVERLWESIWGDSEISMAALHQALRRLRVQTGLAMAARDGHCAIRSDWEAIEYDVRAFEQALEPPINREAVQRVVALYRGDFLPSAPLSAALWVDTRRAHLQQRYLDALEQLAHAAERDAPQLAIHYYQQVLQVDGCREQTAAQLMRLAARFGNRSLVNATFEHLKGSLRTLGAQPEPSTAALFQQLH
jgi:ATP/maltotriose-dependent transcriptional regulator MalT/DNA-binding SARP family transcriptional activator